MKYVVDMLHNIYCIEFLTKCELAYEMGGTFGAYGGEERRIQVFDGET